MNDVLLEYVMKVNRFTPIPSPSTQRLHNVLAVVKQKTGETPQTVIKVTSVSELAAITDTTAPMSLIEGGLTSFFALPMDALTLDSAAITNMSEFDYFTILIDPAFGDEALAGLTLPKGFDGVVGISSSDDNLIEKFVKKENHCAFCQAEEAAGNNMFKAFGSLLAYKKNKWTNQQYIAMDYSDNVNSLDAADALFEIRASFVLTSPEYGNRLAFFVCGGNSGAVAIAAPYIYQELITKLQGSALTWLNLNEPDYTTAEAALLENQLQKVIDKYIESGQISAGSIAVTADQDNFVMSAAANVPQPKATWRIVSTMSEGE